VHSWPTAEEIHPSVRPCTGPRDQLKPVHILHICVEETSQDNVEVTETGQQQSRLQKRDRTWQQRGQL
jgi:hypothetical protein